MSKARKIIIAIGVFLLAAAIGLSTALTVVEIKRQKSDMRLNNIHEKSYYETMTSLDNISTKLNKVGVLTGTTLTRELLTDIWNECGIAATNMSQLSPDSENLNKAIDILNQVGDYCRYLSKRISKSPFTESEIKNLDTFNKAIGNIRTELFSVQDQLLKGDKIDAKLLSDLSGITDSLGKIDYSSVDYPELIYDGPFSDGLNDREGKFLTGMQEITPERGTELIASYFPGAADIIKDGESSGSVACYIYSFTLDGASGSAYITKIGGKVFQYNAYSEITNPTLTEEECVQKAEEYMTALGYSNMKPVWISNNNSTVYINFAHTQNDVVYYPDLVKLKINGETGGLIGVEAQNYIYNHVERSLTLPQSVDHIAISASLTVKSKVLCLVPTDWNTEILCLEVVATKNEQTYYIYYNLETGEEERVLIVIDEDGQLLI